MTEVSSAPGQNVRTSSPLLASGLIRFKGELVFADALAATGIFVNATTDSMPESARLRRSLLSSHVKLSENMAPEVFSHAARAIGALGLLTPVEIYQAAGDENASNWICPDVAFIALQGKLATLLDADSFTSLLGHEFGHHLAHTDSFGNGPRQRAIRHASGIAYDSALPTQVRVVASRLAMAKEFTADRYAAIAAGGLSGPLRLLMTIVTGLPSERLKDDADAYLAQANALFATGTENESQGIGSHPEHLLRAYALSIFTESDLFHAATGQGLGSRPIAEVDEILGKILVGAGEHVFETGNDEVLSPEIQEFSLAAACIMATADGDLDESESKSIEETFSPVLAHWQELLDPDKALARFQELLPLAIAGGESVATSVFSVLVHIMLADREVHVRELEVLASIGRSLRREYLFDYLLDAVARTVRLERSERPVDRPLPALPPGSDEALAALNGLLAGLSRRSGGSVALSRILRILGEPTLDASLLCEIESNASKHRLILAAPPAVDENGSYRPDQSLLFRLDESEVLRREKVALSGSANGLSQAKTRDALVTALKYLRERLVSGDGRSPSIRLYRTVSGRHLDLAQIDRVITGRSERIVALLQDQSSIPLLGGDEAGMHKAAADLARTIRNLDRESKARVEETGTKDFFVGYPFLIGTLGGFFVRGPLMLHPFSLMGDGKGAGSYSLKRRDQEPAIANQALLRLLFAKKGYAFTEELATTLDSRAAEGCEALLGTLHDIGLDARPLTGSVVPFEEMNAAAATLLPEGFSVAECAVAGFFPQSNSDLLQDYDELLSKLDSNDPAALEQALNSASHVLPAQFRPEFFPATDAAAPDQPVVYSDPSQRAAVLRSRGARLMVLDGPPGTGKSQTIVNLVADTLARGGKVAVICEKRVALDVVKQRLDSAGLGHLAAVVHDVFDDRKALYNQIADRIEHPDRRLHDGTTLFQLRAEARDIEARLEMRVRLLSDPTPAGLSLGQLHTLAASFTATVVTASGLEALGFEKLQPVLTALKEIHPLARHFSSTSIFRSKSGQAPRGSLAGATSDQFAEIHQSLRTTRETAGLYGQAYSVTPLPADGLIIAESALQLVAALSQPDDSLGTLLAIQLDSASRGVELENALAAIESGRRAIETENERVVCEDSPELTTALLIARGKVGSFFRFLSPAWRKASAALRAFLLRDWPEKSAAKIDAALIAAIERRLQAARVWTSAEGLYRILQIPSQLPRNATDLLAKLPAFIKSREISTRLIQFRPGLDALGLWQFTDSEPNGGWAAWATHCQSALALLAAQRNYHFAVAVSAATFPVVQGLPPEELAKMEQAFAADATSLAAADRILYQIQSFFPDAVKLVESLADFLPESRAEVWTDAISRAWAEARIAALEAADPMLKALDEPPPLGSLEKASARLLELHQAIAREESLRIAAAGDQNGLMSVLPAEARARRSSEQAARENLIRECRKQRNVTPMRTLVRKTAKDGLLDVVPVWLMSPETTAILFPREPIFDLLVIDEASQCTVESGLPVLTRARRAVIAGDDKQMPPSSFFKAGAGLDIDTNEESSEVAADAFDAESLLVLARSTGEGASLRWHYRALFEELIAFSNHSMYGGALLTIPATLSRSAPPAVKWIRIENGTWTSGSNPPEAIRVVDEMARLLARPKPPSIGIVTFNLQQRRTILDEIDARRTADPRFGAAFDNAASAEALDARPFVKNLESVQGDERDVILFSLGYAPVPRKRRDGSEETYVPARFGPLGQKGGERRLNVAVSRAKSEIIVVSSFDPGMLSVAHTKNDGPRMFKAFVEFARHLGEGRRNQAEKILSLVNESPKSNTGKAKEDTRFLPLHHQIALELEQHGLAVETMIGTSEFRLPVAIIHRGNDHTYSLAILCDDGSSMPDIYEDYVHVPNVLAHRNWSHLRITSREWHRNKAEILTRIAAALG